MELLAHFRDFGFTEKHVIESFNVGLIAFCLMCSGVMIPWKTRGYYSKWLNYSAAVLFLSLGTYLFWIAHLFAEDILGDENYDPILLIVRAVAGVAAVIFTYQLYLADGPLYPGRKR